MFSRVMLAAAPLLVLLSSTVQAQAPRPPGVSVESLRGHIEVLASDAYEGRKPGTAGERKTLAYISSQLAAIGFEPAGANGSWYQPVGLVTRQPSGHRALWNAQGRQLPFNQSNLILIGREASEALKNAPVYFVGHGFVSADGKINQLAGADLKGAVALILNEGPLVPNFPSYSDRVKAVTAAGAAAVIGIIGDEVPWSAITASYRAGQNRLQVEPTAQVLGAMPLAEAARLIDQSGNDFGQLLNSGPGPQFKAVRLPLRLSLDVSTYVNAYTSHNVIGRLRGSGRTGESLLYLGHWDHLGICRPEGEADRICNGAVDNASGIAMLIEAARSLARAPRPIRDILFMGTTAEEMGLLGAEYFGRNPVVPLKSIVAAINVDTVAIAGRGEPVAIVGRGTTALDPIVDETARELGRAVDPDTEANAFIPRQDGWALTRVGVPSIMVGGSFSNMSKLGTFLSGPYHKPNDELASGIELGGAAEDTDLLIALGRKLADPKVYRPATR